MKDIKQSPYLKKKKIKTPKNNMLKKYFPQRNALLISLPSVLRIHLFASIEFLLFFPSVLDKYPWIFTFHHILEIPLRFFRASLFIFNIYQWSTASSMLIFDF